MAETPAPSPDELAEALGVSPLPSMTASEKAGFAFIDFLGIYLFQQFFTMLMFALLSAFLVPSSGIDVLRHVFGENGGLGALDLTANSNKQILLLAATLLGNAAVVGLYLFRGRMVYRLSWPALGWRPFRGSLLIKWFGIFFPLVLSFTMAYNALLRILQHGSPKQQVASFLSPEQPLSLRVFALLLILLAAPITEEMLYRGILFPALQRTMGVQAAAVVSGLIFGIAHIETLTIIPLAFLGYLLALSYRASGSLWVPVILHTCNNLLAFLFLLWMPRGGL